MIVLLLPAIWIGLGIYAHESDLVSCNDWTSCEIDSIPEPMTNKFDLKMQAIPASYSVDK